jgi:hypothetical protein
MEPIPEDQLARPSFYFPHHAVIHKQSKTIKLCIVFNSSASCCGMKSFNEIE